MVSVFLFIGLVLAAFPTGDAHGPLPTFGVYDPLVYEIPYNLTPDGKLALDGPTHEESVAIPNDGTPLTWTAAMPFSFRPIDAVRIEVYIQATDVSLTQDPKTGEGFVVELAHNGHPLDSTRRVLNASKPIANAGQVLPLPVFFVSLGNATFARGDTLTLSLATRAPLSHFAVITGGMEHESLLHLQSVRLASLDELALDTGGFAAYPLSTFQLRADRGAGVAVSMIVSHVGVRFLNATFAPRTTVYLVVRGEEPASDAYRDHHFLRKDERDAHAHAFALGPDGPTFRVYPGVAIVIPLESDRATNVTLACVSNCPGGEPWWGRITFGFTPDPHVGPNGYALLQPNGTLASDYTGPIDESAYPATPEALTEQRSGAAVPDAPTALVVAALAFAASAIRRIRNA
ncbi:MAG: hypothetical protein ACYDCK_09445 [Thermoplasmatota archaeon]